MTPHYLAIWNADYKSAVLHANVTACLQLSSSVSWRENVNAKCVFLKWPIEVLYSFLPLIGISDSKAYVHINGKTSYGMNLLFFISQ
jgi:hypothetical protein